MTQSLLPTPDTTVVGKVADGAAVSGNPVLIAGQDGTNAQSIKTDTNGELQVDVLTLPNAVVAGDVSHGTADSGNPVKTGAKTIAFGTNPSAAAAAARTDLYANRHGIQFVLGGHMAPVTKSASYTTTQTNAAFLTPASGKKIVLLGISVFSDTANADVLECRVGFGATTISTTAAVIYHPGIAKGSGVVFGYAGGVVATGATDEVLRITIIGIVGADELTLSVLYFEIES